MKDATLFLAIVASTVFAIGMLTITSSYFANFADSFTALFS